MRPAFYITINGQPMSGGIVERLKSVTINDRDGTKSDSIDLDLNDGPPLFLAIPDKSAIIQCWGGFSPLGGFGAFAGMDYFGAYNDADVNIDCLPYAMQISAKSADMNSKVTEQQERHWDKGTVGDVFGQLASENGLQAQIAPAIAALPLPKDAAGKPWLGMQNESLVHFGRRVGERIGGSFGLKDGKLLMTEKGSGKSPAGAALATLIITPPMIVKGSCKAHFSAREKAKDVTAEYHDADAAERKQVTVPGHPDGAKSHTLRQPFADKDEAERAAKSKAADMSASADTTSVSIYGNTSARGGAQMVYAGVRPGLDGVPFVIDSAAHTFTKSGGYTVNLDGKKKGADGGEGGATS